MTVPSPTSSERLSTQSFRIGFRQATFPRGEDLADDLLTVLDALGSERAALFGSSDCGSLCAMFAAAHPERTSALVLYGTSAKGAMSPDYQIG